MENEKIRPFEYFMMFLFLAVSGGKLFCITNGRYFIPLFLFLSFWFHIKRYHRVRLFNSVGYLFIGWSYAAFHYFLVYPVHEKNTFIPSLLALIGAYLYLSAYSISRFKKIYLNTVYVMSIVSIVLLGVILLGIITPSVLSIDGESAYVFLGHYFGTNGISPRLAGIYWEPGAYQIVLNITFLLYINEFAHNKIDKLDKKKFAVVFVALLLTVSTAGYLFFSLLLAYYGFLRIKENFSVTKLFGISLLSVVVLYGIYQSDAIQGKLQEKNQGYENSSYTIRARDNAALLLMISERPFIGWGRDSADYYKVGVAYGSRTFSNGILIIIASLGFPFFIIYLSYLFLGMKRLFPNRNVLFLVFLFLFLNSFEDFWWLPASLIFFFLRLGTPQKRLIRNKNNNITKKQYNDTSIVD